MPCFKIGSLIAACGVVLAVAPMAYGQKWEVGGGGGASLYNSQTVSAAAGSVDAKFKTGYGFSGYFGQIGDRLGGEVRYTYLSNEMELSGLGKSYSMGGRSQAIHYDLNFYFNSKKS